MKKQKPAQDPSFVEKIATYMETVNLSAPSKKAKKSKKRRK